MPDVLTLFLVIFLLGFAGQAVLGVAGPKTVRLGKRKIRIDMSPLFFAVLIISVLAIGGIMVVKASDNDDAKSALSARYPNVAFEVYDGGKKANFVDPNRTDKVECTATVASTVQTGTGIVLGGLPRACLEALGAVGVGK